MEPEPQTSDDDDDDATAPPDSGRSVARFFAGSITFERSHLLIAGLAATALVGVLLAALAMLAGAELHAQDEVTRLEKALRQAAKDKLALQKQYDELRQAQQRMIAERRCEAADGLDDCLAAGLSRPAQFAEADRQVLEARRAAPAPAAPGDAAPGKAAASAPVKISIGEFVQEIQKIPGVAVDGNASERSVPDRKSARKPGL